MKIFFEHIATNPFKRGFYFIMSNNQSHLEIKGVFYYSIVEQLINHILKSLFEPKHHKSKQMGVF